MYAILKNIKAKIDHFISKIQFFVFNIKLHEIIGFEFLICSIFIYFSRKSGIIFWYNEQGIYVGWLSLLFALSALIILCKPKNLLFILALIPYVILAILFTLFNLSTMGASPTSFIYWSTPFLLMIILYVKKIKNINIYYVLSFVMMFYGIVFFYYNSSGAIDFIHTNYGISGEATSFFFIVSSICLLFNQSKKFYLSSIAILILYYGVTFILVTRNYYNYGLLGFFSSGLPLSLLLYSISHLDDIEA